MRTQFLKYNILEHIIKLGALDEFADIEFLSIQAWLIGWFFIDFVQSKLTVTSMLVTDADDKMFS